MPKPGKSIDRKESPGCLALGGNGSEVWDLFRGDESVLNLTVGGRRTLKILETMKSYFMGE